MTDREAGTGLSVKVQCGSGDIMAAIVFLGGPSGSGKSFFAKYLSGRGWQHLEIDQYPRGDGIDQNGLRAEWDEFLDRCNAKPLYEKLSRPSPAVLSFASNLVFDTRHIRAAGDFFHIAYLYGHPAFCLRSYLSRQQVVPAVEDHWNVNNKRLFAELSQSHNHTRLIEAFTPAGDRREPADIYRDLMAFIKQT